MRRATSSPLEATDIDRHFANFIGDFGGGNLPRRAAALLSRAMRTGSICLDLRRPDDEAAEGWPALAEWRAACAENAAFGPPEKMRPLVLDAAGRLYLRRYWEYQETLASLILKRCASAPPAAASSEADPQRRAIHAALRQRFVVISGGPGTGKTTIVLRLLEQAVAESAGENLRIALAAPTGKAAARLQEAVSHASPALRRCLLGPAATINRLLGSIPGSIYFRHQAKNPLAANLVIVDEASMVSLTMMAKLFSALSPEARVILLGDRDQLASVDAGAVLGDLADAALEPGSPLAHSLIVLEKNYRFGEESGIYQLCRTVRTGEARAAMAILEKGDLAGIVAHSVPVPAQLAKTLAPSILAGFRAYLQTDDPATALARFQEFRVLCALRVGPFGSVALNRRIQEILAAEGLIVGPPGFYRGLPILITRNDYQLRLFNGDIGILLPEQPGSRQLMAWFRGENDELRRLAPARLPEHEPAFAMTIHKSQGSEFEKVLLLLPDEDQAVLSRELVYTGLTRARAQVDLWFREAVLRQAIARRTLRSSGLADRLAALNEP